MDWDVHHGNGTQKMFESDKRVLYISLHRYNNGKFFPSTTDGNYDKVGSGPGEGYNVNIPWNNPGGGLTEADYAAAFNAIVMPIAYQYDPELVLVSAGFDACVNDPIGNCKLSPEFFGHMTYWLTNLANGRVVLSLEGGYNNISTSFAMALCIKALLGDPLPPLTSSSIPSASAVETLRNVLVTQMRYWSCLKFCRTLPEEDVLTGQLKLPELGESVSKSEKHLGIGEMSETNIMPEDANSNERRDGQRTFPTRESDSENASAPAGRPTLVGTWDRPWIKFQSYACIGT